MKKCPKCGVEYPDATTLCPQDGVALETDGDSLIGLILAGKYRIDARLTEGGMGTVYRGTHVLMEKTVAIKVLHPSFAADEKIVARFSREARAASRISHPNALSVTDFGEDDRGHVFLVMEFLSGKTLKELIREEGPLPLQRVVDISRQIGEALNAAHVQGVVHRDLKSDNIMLLDTTIGDYAKVLDFGIAKITEPDGVPDAGLTAPNLVIGTPQYMSPEQCSQDCEIDARSDIYSFGVILFEMLVGHVPFSGESPTMVMMKHLQDPVPSVLDERTDVPAAVGRVIQRAMAKLRDNRYQSVAELIEDLVIASGMTIRRAPSPSEVTSAAAASQMSDEPDEITVVRMREEAPALRRAPVTVPVTPAMPPQAPASFNPMKIIIPSAVALVVIFAAFWIFNRPAPVSSSNTNEQTGTLAADPNSQPVQPGSSPTGRSEQGIPSGGTISPPVIASPSPEASFEPSVEPTAEASPSPTANASPKAPPVPQPTRSVVPEGSPPPPPAPTATKPPASPSPVP